MLPVAGREDGEHQGTSAVAQSDKELLTLRGTEHTAGCKWLQAGLQVGSQWAAGSGVVSVR